MSTRRDNSNGSKVAGGVMDKSSVTLPRRATGLESGRSREFFTVAACTRVHVRIRYDLRRY